MPKFRHRSSKSNSKHKAFLDWNFEGGAVSKSDEKEETEAKTPQDSQRWDEGRRRNRIKQFYAGRRPDSVVDEKTKFIRKRIERRTNSGILGSNEKLPFSGLNNPSTHDLCDILMETMNVEEDLEEIPQEEIAVPLETPRIDNSLRMDIRPAASSHTHPFLEFVKQSSSEILPHSSSQSLNIPCLGTRFESSTDCCLYDIEGNFNGDIPSIQSINQLSGLGTKLLSRNWNKSLVARPDFTTLQTALLSGMQTYSDLVLDGRNYINDEEILRVVLVHVLSHVIDGCSRVYKHDANSRKQAKDDAVRRRKEEDRRRLIRAGVPVDDEVDDGKQQKMKSKRKTDDSDNGDGKKKKKKRTTTNDAVDDTSDIDDAVLLAGEDSLSEPLRDQGFCRPRSLLLMPTIGCAVRAIQAMIDILGPGTVVDGIDYLEEETGLKFVSGDVSRDGCGSKYVGSSEDGDGLVGFERLFRDLGVLKNSVGNDDDDDAVDHGDSETAAKTGKTPKKRHIAIKPRDWKMLFDLGSDDDFVIGIAIILQDKRKKTTNLRIEPKLDRCDIILGSPLGIRMAAIKEASRIKKSSRMDDDDGADDVDVTPGLVDECYDFLSSIELSLLYQADALVMQNWDHLLQVFERINTGVSSRGRIDFSRVRNYFLEEDNAIAKKFRQNIMISSIMSPEMNQLVNTLFTSHVGNIRIRPRLLQDKLPMVVDVNSSSSSVSFLLPNEGEFDVNDAVPSRLKVVNRYRNENCKYQRINQTLCIAPCNRPDMQDDAKFNVFVNVILPIILNRKLKHVLIVVSSYFDYVRIRNELMVREASAVFVSEYSRTSEISRGRSWFFHGIKDILCYSLRSHFYNRYEFRNAKHVLFYGVPVIPTFYSDILSKLAPCENAEEQGLWLNADDDGLKMSAGNSSVLLCTKYETMALTRIFGSRVVSYVLGSDCACKTTFTFQQTKL